jgi:hypothetical protein
MTSLPVKTEKHLKTEAAFAALGFFVASAIPAMVLSVLWPLDGHHQLVSIFLSIVVVYPFSAILTVGLGLPAFLLLRPFRPGHWWSVLGAGFLLGVLASIILRLPGSPNPHDFLADGPAGALAALAFWAIWVRHARREEKS